MGNPSELSYLHQSLQKQALDTEDQQYIIHSATSNDGRTTDGIVRGGERLADEVNQLVQHLREQQRQPRISLSLIGNSLGGLYARYALSLIDTTSLELNSFITTATPHLGVGVRFGVRLDLWRGRF